MGNFVVNQALGRVAEFGNRINNNDPANSAFIISLWNTVTGDATLRDLDTVAAFESDGGTAELTDASYGRKTLTDASSITVTVDDTNDRTDVDCPDQTWTALAGATPVTDLMVSYDSDTTGGTDANQVPCTWHDFAVTPDGSDVVAQISVFYRASAA